MYRPKYIYRKNRLRSPNRPVHRSTSKRSKSSNSGVFGFLIFSILVAALLLLPKEYKSSKVNALVDDLAEVFRPESIKAQKQKFENKLTLIKKSKAVKSIKKIAIFKTDLSSDEKYFIAQLKKSPCNDTQADNLTKAHWASKNYQRILIFERRYSKKCGGIVELKWIAFEAAKASGKNRLALKKINRLIKYKPMDKDYLSWRGLLYQRMNKYSLAIRDYEKVIKIAPRIKSIPLNLVEIYRDSDQPCQARGALKRYLRSYPDLRTDDKIYRLFNEVNRACNRNGTI